MNYVLDLAAAAVVIICVIVGAKKGAARMLIAAVGYAAALAAAIFVSEAADEYVYDAFVKPSVSSALEKKAEELSETYSEERLEEFLLKNGISPEEKQLLELIDESEEYRQVLTNEEIRDKLNNVFIDYCRTLTEAFSGTIPEELLKEAYRYIDETEMDNRQKLELLSLDGKAAAELVEREIIRPVLLKTVRMVLFFLTFAVVSAAVWLISAVVSAVRGISAVRQTDDFFGGMLGFLQGIIVSAAMCVLAEIFIQLTMDENQYINSVIISQTIIFKRMYSGTIFLLSLRF